MSLASRISALASRVGLEVKTKIDATHLLQMFAEGFFADEVPLNSPLHQRLVKLVEARLAARV